MAKEQSNKTGQPTIDVQATLEVDEWYDLLPIEKKLISYSLGLGLALLAIFIVIFGVLK
ncbi:hypothetical protein [Desulfosporosinus metallidurans]|uniref:Uncharacterized protein n=1 Tax=Desulfosporosinus metallidurans TaxID=1888891 RepID=A0A1Q8QZD4_9FIRM|nr:hypothetical protein [Desulfosporosinus metallidurans]OLN32704.1 hypothetical protein DSOL_1455 [Desulfosporosinus metallidurans]